MVIKIYISGISGNKEVKKRQQRVFMILDSKNVEYESIDITEPGKEDVKEFMQSNSKARDSKYPLPPQIFNEDDYCGDYEDFDLANEINELEAFLKVTPESSTAELTTDSKSNKDSSQQNGNTSSREPSTDKDAVTVQSESLEERTGPVSENGLEDNKTVKSPEIVKKDTEDDEADQMEDNADKNKEEKNDQEKEE
ncbi:SH3 domain-binding glutamic acid-rich protein homolog isoform X1 [Prorops nasuta]|uniref:SH3 domain-binding glutamic acid-rich protein homolog isoform X1 n=1 Tax=Prorops nasuta TaxID=863751 RepID=UPI0034CD4354